MEQIRSSPRVEGIREQFERSKLFLKEASASTDRLARFRRLVASIYFARAVVELMLEAADKQEVKKGRKELEKMLKSTLPRYLLIEKLRIHDFHRFGLLERPGFFLGGTIKLIANQGGASLRITPWGPKITLTGSSRVKRMRPLTMNGDKALDEDKNEYIPIERILSEYLDAVPKAIDEFLKLR
jgi:hypothetical protein